MISMDVLGHAANALAAAGALVGEDGVEDRNDDGRRWSLRDELVWSGPERLEKQDPGRIPIVVTHQLGERLQEGLMNVEQQVGEVRCNKRPLERCLHGCVHVQWDAGGK